MYVLAFPTYHEGFGLVAIEASTMGVPVISTKIPDCIYAVLDSVTGTVVSVGNTPDLELAIECY